jgi:hypothetical protein
MSEQTKASVPLTITPEATEFLRQHQAEEAFRTSCEWVRERFPELVRLHARLENDWDEPGIQYVVLDATLPKDYPYDQLREQKAQLYQRRAELMSAATRELICHEFQRVRE